MKLEEITSYTIHHIFGTFGGETCDEDLKIRWHSEHLKMLLASGMTEEEADKKAIIYVEDRFLKLKKARSKNNPTELKKCEYCNIATFYYQRCLINNHKKNIVK
ncbi:MAG: hypothetical protein ACI8RD_004948 [Bacillariaceae sp.]|jgi:hypothetical protein